MSSPRTTILKFPDVRDFFGWLKQRDIHEYGSVVMEEVKPSSKGIAFVTYSVRMSAKDPQRSEIIQCEVPFYNGIWISREHNREEAEKAEVAMKAYIEKVHKEVFKDYEISVISAEFQAGEEKD